MQILEVKKGFGILQQFSEDKDKRTESVFNLPETDFYAEMVLNKKWLDYGHHESYTITLHTQDKKDSFTLNDMTFSVEVSLWYYYQTGAPISSHTFTFSGRERSGKLFHESFTLRHEAVLPGIVYAIIFMAFVGDVAKAKVLWDLMDSQKEWRRYTGELVDHVVTLRGICQRIIREYPFMELFLQEGLQKATEKAKKHLDEIGIL